MPPCRHGSITRIVHTPADKTNAELVITHKLSLRRQDRQQVNRERQASEQATASKIVIKCRLRKAKQQSVAKPFIASTLEQHLTFICVGSNPVGMPRKWRSWMRTKPAPSSQTEIPACTRTHFSTGVAEPCNLSAADVGSLTICYTFRRILLQISMSLLQI